MFVGEPLRAPLQFGEHITWISTLIAMFGLGNDAPLLVPSLGVVLELGKSHFEAASAVLALSAFLQVDR